jgi:NADPH2:quinone reductase
VVEVGNDVGDLEVGDRVAVYSGLGAYAEEVAAPAGSAFKLPTGLPWAEAAGLAVAYGTSYHGLVDRAGLQSGETLLVLGAAGGVGSAAVEIGKALGAKVIAAVSSQTKAEFVLGLGADEVIRYDQEILRDRLKGGVDVVYDPVGGDHTETAFRSLAWGGRHLVVGFSAGAIPRLPVNLALLKGGSLVGVFWGRFVETEPERARANLRRLAQWWDKGLITIPVWRRFPLAEAPTAMDEVEGRRALGKVVLEISG